ncbi:hypothetical protein ILUMI_11594 [Ignelater luminosus]|uniref:DUF7869 domain-containing protein n=1 Tax=Ignelater luminosus TaxID=2038154 RepID=A0A8K0CVX9_IGNLU|nr:hypothetical protein ILUMI_11594 [Ignelater luminosus]
MGSRGKKMLELLTMHVPAATRVDKPEANDSGSDTDPYASDSGTDNYLPKTTNTSSSETEKEYGNRKDDTPAATEQEAVNYNREVSKQPKSARKRKCNIKEWKRNKAKRLRNSGKSYINTSKKAVPARRTKEACRDICHLRCKANFSEQYRQKNFSEYWELADVKRQRDFVARFIEFKPKRQNRLRLKNRQEEKQYNCNNLQIHEQIELSTRGKMSYFYYFSTEDRNKVKVCQTLFLNTLSISHQIVKTIAQKTVTSNTVARDNRGQIQNISGVSDDKKESIRRHIPSFDTVETEEKHCVAIYDLQQVLQCPKIEVGQAYYKSKLSVYNLTIYDAGQKQGYCYMWHEYIASRGSYEIGSCVLSFIKQKTDEGYKELIFYSDNCPRQNRNKYIFCMYLFAAMNYNITITRNFMEVGHTQNEGDSMHSTIERCAKHVSIYVPSQWYVIARTAYLVANSTKNTGKDRLRVNVKWCKIRSIRVDSQKLNVMQAKYEFVSDYFDIDVTESSHRRLTSLIGYNLKQLRNSLIPISEQKHKSILDYCKNNAVTKEY